MRIAAVEPRIKLVNTARTSSTACPETLHDELSGEIEAICSVVVGSKPTGGTRWEKMEKNQLKVVGLGRIASAVFQYLPAVLRVALEGAAEVGATTKLLDIKELSLPMYDPANENLRESVRKVCDAIHGADGLIWSSPMVQRYDKRLLRSCKELLKVSQIIELKMVPVSGLMRSPSPRWTNPG
jgi:hypothetical protein